MDNNAKTLVRKPLMQHGYSEMKVQIEEKRQKKRQNYNTDKSKDESNKRF